MQCCFSVHSCRQQELGQGHLAALWATVIESGLLFSPSLERKAVALQLFCILLPHIAAADVPIVFSTPFVRLLGSSLKGKEQSLHKGAVRCIDRLADWAQTAHKNSSQGATALASGQRMQRRICCQPHACAFRCDLMPSWQYPIHSSAAALFPADLRCLVIAYLAPLPMPCS